MKKYPSIAAFVLMVSMILPPGAAAEGDEPQDFRIHSAGPKFVLFIPNTDTAGLKDFTAGLGVGGEVMFTIARTGFMSVQAGPEMEGVISGMSERVAQGMGTMDINGSFLSFREKGNLALVFPLEPVSLYIGGGLVFDYSIVVETARNNTFGPDTDLVAVGAGIGAQALGGLNIRAGRRGAVTAGFTIPIGQKHSMSYTITDHSTSKEIANGTFDMNVGGVELYAGYRFFFALAHPAPEPVPQPGQ